MTTTSTISTAPALAGTTWTIDPAHSSVEFAVKHMMVATVRGRFADVAGTLDFAGEDLATGRADVTIGAASIDTRSAQRDAHLRSADFFDVERYPEIRFTSSAVEPVGEDRVRINGELAMHGHAHQITLDAEFAGSGIDPWGATRLAFTATGKLDRRDYGLAWNQALETGGILVGDEVRITIDVQLVRQ